MTTKILSSLLGGHVDIEEQREVLKALVRDSIAMGRPEDATKGTFGIGYGDLALDDIFYIIEEEYKGTRLEGVTTFSPPSDVTPSQPIMQELRDWLSQGQGTFTAFQIDREFGFLDRVARKQRAKYLRRFVEEGLIEPIPDRINTFRVQNKALVPIKYAKPGAGEPIILPMGLHKLIKLFPGNVGIIAGTYNAGKTAMMLNLLMNNIGLYKVHYFSSEMGAEEISLRLSQFARTPPETIFEQANIYERANDFADVIVPGRGNLNLIDYLEVGDSFWQIGEIIESIWGRLQGALAFIAIQKKRKALLGRGAEFGVEKPRLYLSVDNSCVKIVKAKTWRNSADNPNGKQCQFTLRNGCEFIQGRMGWHHTS